MTRKPRRLPVNRETLKQLGDGALGDVRGGVSSYCYGGGGGGGGTATSYSGKNLLCKDNP